MQKQSIGVFRVGFKILKSSVANVAFVANREKSLNALKFGVILSRILATITLLSKKYLLPLLFLHAQLRYPGNKIYKAGNKGKIVCCQHHTPKSSIAANRVGSATLATKTTWFSDFIFLEAISGKSAKVENVGIGWKSK